MTYSFDVIKSNVKLFLFILLPIFIFILLLLISHTNGMEAYLPDLFVRSIMTPIYTCILVAMLFIWNRKKLFWTKITLEIDKNISTLKVNGQSLSFSDLEFYEYRPGSIFTTGGLPVLFFKFRNEKLMMVMPCKSSSHIHEYNQFRIEFDQLIQALNLDNKKKKLNKFGRAALILICILIPLVFTGVCLSKGITAAFKLIPALLILGTICGVNLYLDRKKS